ncbi:MAG: nucleotide exchange factor GrpE [Thermodesulfobacteriota bacterium]|nr:nucleotide exchange factor GrpE [Thermodesulfobacteriota bacterium]
MKKINKILKTTKDSLDTYLIIPVMKFIIAFFTKKMEQKRKINFSESAFKRKALEDYKSWLADIILDDSPKMDVTPDTCDLYTMLSEFTALRQEIKMQNREQHKTLNRLQSYTDTYQENSELFKKSITDITELEKRIRLNCEKKSAALFFNVRDALIRGHMASIEIKNRKSFFKPRAGDMENISKGYEMAVRRFDRALALMDIYPVKTESMPFDPKTMNAVDTKKIHGCSKGIVAENLSCGFLRDNEVLKYAEVIVTK